MGGILINLSPNFQIDYSEERVGFKTCHFYKVANQKLPSVSAILEVLDAGKSGALSYWSKKTALDSMKSALESKLSIGVSLSEEDLEEAYSSALKSPDRLKKEAADVGTECHNAIDALINLKPIPQLSQQAQAAFKNFLNWTHSLNLTFQSGDIPVASPSLGFGGRLDALASDQQNNLILLDWKTTNKLKVHNFYQVAAYALALKETYNLYPTKAFIVKFPKSDSKIQQLEVDLKSTTKAFLALLKLYYLHQPVEQYFNSIKGDLWTI